MMNHQFLQPKEKVLARLCIAVHCGNDANCGGPHPAEAYYLGVALIRDKDLSSPNAVDPGLSPLIEPSGSLLIPGCQACSLGGYLITN